MSVDLHSSFDSDKDFLNLSQDDDFDLELQDISDDNISEYSQNASSGEEVHENKKHNEEKSDLPTVSQNENITTCTALVAAEEDDDGDDIDSEEERDLLKGIKEEIQEMVREEMKDELDVYRVKLKAIEQGQIDVNAKPEKDAEDGLEDMDPKLREAYVKMKKLDRILAKKLKKEKEVKRDRILLEKKIREEIAAIKTQGRVQKDIQSNTEKFVALALPPSHNEGVDVNPRPVSPVFQTQLNENDFEQQKENDKRNENAGESRSSSAASQSTNATSGENDRGSKARRKKKKKDFIRRNKELAAVKAEIAMTEEEKKRVGELLADLDSIPEGQDDINSIDQESGSQMISVTPGDGYNPDMTEKDSLTYIDGCLRMLLPNEEYESLVTAPSRASEQHKCFTRVDVMSCIENDRYGERVLLETKEERDMQTRLKAIEEELSYFHNPMTTESESPRLSEDQLNSLLDQCVRSLSRTSRSDCTTEDNNLTSRSDLSSSRLSIMENPPRLPEDVLQKLLAEAQFPLSSRLGTLEEEENGEAEGEGQKAILAETWKTIVEEDESSDPIKTAEELYSRSSTHLSLRNALESHNILGRPISNQSYRSYDMMDNNENRLILPEINSSPFLVSQGLNNQLTKNESHSKANGQMASARSSIDILRNNLCDGDYSGGNAAEERSSSFEMSMPQPPAGERRPGQTSRLTKSASSGLSTPTVRTFDGSSCD